MGIRTITAQLVDKSWIGVPEALKNRKEMHTMKYKNPIPNIDDGDDFEWAQGVEIGKCEFCGKDDLPITSTSAIDSYCRDCLKITINECKSALMEIDEYEKINNIKKSKSKKSNKKSIDELRKAKDDAVKGLMQEKD